MSFRQHFNNDFLAALNLLLGYPEYAGTFLYFATNIATARSPSASKETRDRAQALYEEFSEEVDYKDFTDIASPIIDFMVEVTNCYNNAIIDFHKNRNEDNEQSHVTSETEQKIILSCFPQPSEDVIHTLGPLSDLPLPFYLSSSFAPLLKLVGFQKNQAQKRRIIINPPSISTDNLARMNNIRIRQESRSSFDTSKIPGKDLTDEQRELIQYFNNTIAATGNIRDMCLALVQLGQLCNETKVNVDEIKQIISRSGITPTVCKYIHNIEIQACTIEDKDTLVLKQGIKYFKALAQKDFNPMSDEILGKQAHHFITGELSLKTQNRPVLIKETQEKLKEIHYLKKQLPENHKYFLELKKQLDTLTEQEQDLKSREYYSRDPAQYSGVLEDTTTLIDKVHSSYFANAWAYIKSHKWEIVGIVTLCALFAAASFFTAGVVAGVVVGWLSASAATAGGLGAMSALGGGSLWLGFTISGLLGALSGFVIDVLDGAIPHRKPQRAKVTPSLSPIQPPDLMQPSHRRVIKQLKPISRTVTPSSSYQSLSTVSSSEPLTGPPASPTTASSSEPLTHHQSTLSPTSPDGSTSSVAQGKITPG